MKSIREKAFQKIEAAVKDREERQALVALYLANAAAKGGAAHLLSAAEGIGLKLESALVLGS